MSSFFVGFCSNLQITRTCIKSQRSSKSGLNYLTIECWKSPYLTLSQDNTFIFYWIFVKSIGWIWMWARLDCSLWSYLPLRKPIFGIVRSIAPSFLYPWHLCRGYIVFAFLFVCSFVTRSRHVRGIYSKVLHASFSSGVNLTNHSSESIHIWTIGTLEGQLSFHGSWPQGGARGQNLGHL